MSDVPFLLVIAGPNGSGKSTLTNYLIEAGIDFGEYINPGEIAATLDLREPVRSKQAQAIADLQRGRCLTSRLNFSFETVMSHRSKVDFKPAPMMWDTTSRYILCVPPTRKPTSAGSKIG